MNQLVSQAQQQSQAQGNAQPHQINVNIDVTLSQSNINMKVQIYPETPFFIFINGIKEEIFTQAIPIHYDKTIKYQLDDGRQINESESRSLKQLGFNANCTLYVQLKLQ